jgi:hypothetical protein
LEPKPQRVRALASTPAKMMQLLLYNNEKKKILKGINDRRFSKINVLSGK